MNNKILLWAVVILLIIGGFWLVKNKSATAPISGDSIKIGYIGPFTGPVAGTSGEDVANGWKLAASVNNVADGKAVEVIYEDDGCDPQKAVAAANKLTSIDGVKILVSGVCSGSTLAVAPLAEQNKVILFTPVSTSPKITDAGDYVFRTSGSSVASAEAVSALINKLGYNSVAVLFENAEYTVGYKDAFLKTWNSVAGNKIVAIESIQSKEPDLRTPLTKLNAAKPPALVVIMNSTVTATAFIKQYSELGIKLPVIGNEYFAYREVLDTPQAEGMYAATYKYDDSTTAFKNFLDLFKKTYNKEPGQEIYAAQAYDGYNVVFNAIKSCGNDDPECIKKELYGTQNYQGLTGTISIDKNGDTSRQFTVKQIIGGKLVDPK